jgi:hypothetical protein
MSPAPAVTTSSKRWSYPFFCCVHSAVSNAKNVIIILCAAGGWKSDRVDTGACLSSTPCSLDSPEFRSLQLDMCRELFFYSSRPGQVLINRVVSMGQCNTASKSTRRSFKTQGLSWPLIQAQGDFVQIRLREARQIGFLGQVLS